MARLRFGVLVSPDASFEERRSRWQLVEDLGFDFLYGGDHSRDYRREGPWFDGWTDIAAMAISTSRIRIGPLASNPILRGPTLLAREAVAVDDLSGGRLELAIGTGIAGFDHQAMGVPYWDPKERVRRYREYIAIVDGLLRTTKPYDFQGVYYSTQNAVMYPGPVQRPRPPITIAGQSPAVRRIAAEHGDCWNTHGPYDRTFEEIVEITARQNVQMDEACRAAGREPADVRRSLLMFGPLDPFPTGIPMAKVVDSFADAGVQEFVVFWPDAPDAARIIEDVAATVVPRYR